MTKVPDFSDCAVVHKMSPMLSSNNQSKSEANPVAAREDLIGQILADAITLEEGVSKR